jgi:predicted phosphate transport protein (TIGR00153 family)
MFGRLLPEEHGFFEFFKESADLMVASMTEFRRMLDYPNEMSSRSRTIKDLEHRADEVTHKTMTLLHRTFITPLDRDEIHHLIKSLDDIVDFIDASAQRLDLYEVRRIPDAMRNLADTTVESVELVRKAVSMLSNMKNSAAILPLCVEINRLENQADQILRAAVAQLFREEQDLRLLIKLKEIYELLETVTDRCEDVANIIETIVLEHA